MQDLIDPQFRDQFDTYLRDIARTGESHGTMAVMTRSGERRIWEYHNTLRTEGMEAPIVRGIAHDVTERVRAQGALRESEQSFRAVYERSPIGIALVESRTGRILQVNPKYCEITGRSEEELLGMDVRSITHPGDVGSTSENLRQLAAEQRPNYEMDKRYVRPDGSVRWVRVQVVPMWGRGQTDRLHMGLVQDITEGKQAEEALRTSEREQHKIAEQLEIERARLIEAQAVAKVGSWEVELPSLDIIWSEQTHRIFETNPSSFHPRRPGFVELVHPEDRAKLDAAFAASLEKGTPATVEYRTVMADGRVKVLEEHWKVFHDGQGRPARLIGTCQDITERKQSEEAIARLVQEVCEAKKKLTEEKLYLEH